MKMSTLLLVPAIALSALVNHPAATEATPLLVQRLQRTEIQSNPSHTRPTDTPAPGSTTNTILQASTDGGTAITCINGTCYCNGNDDCDALFTSNKCTSGTATTSPDDESGQCEQND
ncbi:MAG: hypothetical protein AAFQ63_22120 [Cyanobacteria bacterium J06621_11]